MKFLLFFVLFLNATSTVISGMGFNGTFLLQPVPSPGFILRRTSRLPSPFITTRIEKNWPTIIYLKNLLEMKCLRDIYVRSRLKNRFRIPKIQSGFEVPAYRLVYKNQRHSFENTPDMYRPIIGFQNRRRYLGGNIRVVPMLPPPFWNINHLGHKTDVGKNGQRSNEYVSGISKAKVETIPQDVVKIVPSQYRATNKTTTTTTTTTTSTVKPVNYNLEQHKHEQAKAFNEPVTNIPEIHSPQQKNFPIMANRAVGKTFPPLPHQLTSTMKPTTTASHSKNTPLNTLWRVSKPHENVDNSHEFKESIEESIKFDLEEKKKKTTVTKKPSSGRKSKFDKNNNFKIVVPDNVKLVKNKELDNSINTILNSLFHLEKKTIRIDNEENPFENSVEKTEDSYDYISEKPSSPQTKEDFYRSKETFTTFTLLPSFSVHSIAKSSPLPHANYTTTKSVGWTPSYSKESKYNSSRTSTTSERPHEEKKNKFHTFLPHSHSQNSRSWEQHSTTRQYEAYPNKPSNQKEPQQKINFQMLEETDSGTDQHVLTTPFTVKPKDTWLPDVLRYLTEIYSNAEKVTLPPKVKTTKENKTSSTFPATYVSQKKNSSSTTTSSEPKQTNSSTEKVSFAPESKDDNNSDFKTSKNPIEEKKKKVVEPHFSVTPLTLKPIPVHQNTERNTETTTTEKSKETTSTELLEIQTDFDLLDTTDEFTWKTNTATEETEITTTKSFKEKPSFTKPVEFEELNHKLFTELPTTEFPQKETTSPSSTSVGVTKTDFQTVVTTQKNNYKTSEEDKDMKNDDMRDFVDVSLTVDLLNSLKKDTIQELTWKNSRKMHFNQEPSKPVNNLLNNSLEKDQRRSDILINDTLEEYSENLNQLSSLQYVEKLKENSSQLSPGSLIKIAPESIIPVIPTIINDLRDDRLTEDDVKVLSHAFGKYWPSIMALSNNTNLDILILIKMKTEKDLENVLTTFVTNEPKVTTTAKFQDEGGNTVEYGPTYDYLDDYKEIYQDVLNQVTGKEKKKKIRIRRDEEDDSKKLEATREYFESVAEEQNIEVSDYIYEDIMYDDTPDDESDSSTYELV